MNIAVLVLTLTLSTTLANCKDEINRPFKNGFISLQDFASYKLISRIKRSLIMCSKNPEEGCYDEINTKAQNIESINIPPDVENLKRRFKRATRCEGGTQVVGCYICACNVDGLTYDICFPLHSCYQQSL